MGACPPRGRPVYSDSPSLSTGDRPLIPAIREAVDAALEKKAIDLVVLDLRGLSDVTDFFVICHGTSDRQVIAIADAVEERLRRALKRRPGHVEGRPAANWILMDYFEFVVHVFLDGKREFYRLESLWGDAPRVPTDDAPRSRKSTSAESVAERSSRHG